MLFFLLLIRLSLFFTFFFFNDTATTEIYTLSLHDALPISCGTPGKPMKFFRIPITSKMVICILATPQASVSILMRDRKSTRLNSSHLVISYAVFCLKKKKKKHRTRLTDYLYSKDARYRHVR